MLSSTKPPPRTPPPAPPIPPPAPPIPPLAPPAPPLAPPATPLTCSAVPPPPPLRPLSTSLNDSGPHLAEKSCGSNGSTISPAALKGLKSNEIVNISHEEMINGAIKRFINFNPEYKSCNKEVFNHSTQPQLQEGPQCGLVAVSMASKLYNSTKHVSPDQLLDYAQKQGYTKLGEMFSALNMLDLCSRFIPGESQLLPIEYFNNTLQMCQDFLSGHIFIVPYDCDFSHGPCLAEGKKAHWTLITGFILLSNGEENFTFKQDQQISPDCLQHKEIKLFGRQSKSLVLGIWNLEELIASNKNLKVVDDKRNPEDYIIPEEGIEAALANQIIRLKIDKLNNF